MNQAKKQKPRKGPEQISTAKITAWATVIAAIVTAITAIIVAVVNKPSLTISAPPNPLPKKLVSVNREAFGLLWHVYAGDPVTSPDAIHLDGPVDIQTNDTYRFGNLLITARSDQWSPDTSFGFEIWDPRRYSIRVDGGKLIIRNHGEDKKPLDIPAWSALKKENLRFKICWSKRQVDLYINDQRA